MNKKGQITVFIIIALILVVGIVIFFVAKNKLGTNLGIPNDIVPIKDFVQSCMKTAADNSLLTIGIQGGYYVLPSNNLDDRFVIYFENNQSLVPSKGEIENQLSRGFKAYLDDCLGNFDNFKQFSINKGIAKIEVTVNKENVIFNLEYPLTISSADKVNSLKDFKEVKVNINLGKIQELILNATAEQMNNPEGICISCYSNLDGSSDFRMDIVGYNEGSFLFILEDNNIQINDKAYKFVFANKY